MEIRENIDELLVRVACANICLKNAKSAEERIAMANYIANLYESIMLVTETPIIPRERAVFGSHKNYHKFNKKVNILDNQVVDNFIINKPYHNYLLGSILDQISNPLDTLTETNYGDNKTISKREFFDIFYLFLESLKLDKEYDEFIKKMGIYSYDKELKDVCKGYILYNPINKDTDVFVGDFDYDVSTLYTLAHEFGHAYDMSKLGGDVNTYNKYFYQSFYGESVSKLFERLLLEYLINNNILLENSKNELLDMEFDNYTMMIFSYIISLLDDEILKKHKQDKFSSEYLYTRIEKDFDESVMEMLDEKDSLEIHENFIYTYGDIISMFLKERVKEEGFNNDMLFELFERRGEIFSPEFIEDFEMTPDNYVKAYQKELKLLKK